MKTYRLFLLTAAAVLAAGLLPSCQQQPEEEPLFFDIVEGGTNLRFDAAGGSREFVVYSNLGRWRLINEYGEDDGWVAAWPVEGEGDARFTVNVSKNKSAASRQAVLNLVVDGQSLVQLTLNQVGVEPSLKLVNVPEAGRIVGAKASKFNISVDANVAWTAEVLGDVPWLRVGEYGDDFQTFEVDENTGGERTAEVIIRAYGTDFVKVVPVRQQDASSSFDAATKVTIEQLLKYPDGLITDNVYVEGTVISDRLTHNYPVKYKANAKDNTMFIQDETAGLWIEFEDESDNVYDLNDDLVVHMVGQHMTVDSYTNGKLISGLTGISVIDSKPGTGVTPIVVEDISDLSRYENMLVTLKNVEFVLPYGNLCNINEAGYRGVAQSSSYQKSSDYNDLTIEYGHYLRDASNHYAKLYTTYSFREAGLHLIPEGSGDVTGIVGKRYKADRYKGYSPTREKEESWCIRVRRESDITNYSADATSRLSTTIVQFGPWIANKEALTEVRASVGTGIMKHSVGTTVLGSTSGVTDQMYWAWAHARNAPATLSYDAANDDWIWLPSYGNSLNIQYTALMAQNWWKNVAAILSDTDGCCWIFSDLSTAGYPGQITLAFTASSNTSGPIEFQLEWAEEDTAKEWTPIGTPYVAANWHCDIHAPEYVFELPPELSNKAKFSLRLRATIQRNASDSDDIASGTSRIGIFRLSTLK